MADPFASAQDFAQFMGLTLPTDLARMQQHLDLASAMIRRYCDQVLSVVTAESVTLAAVDRDTLVLPERPVTAITSVTENALAVTDYTFTRAGLIHRPATWLVSGDGMPWIYGATVVYTHGYAETTEQYKAIKGICLEVAARAYTLNERSASEALGNTLMESAGYSPEVFLTPGEKATLTDFGKVYVG